jgi:hypothetical protein
MPWGVPEELIDQAAQQLGLTAVTDAQLRPDGTLVLLSRGKTYTIPVPTGESVTTTLPHSGPNAPARLSEPPNGEPDQPQPAGVNRQAGPGSPFTNIPGVGPVTADKLHDAGYFTYTDLDSSAISTVVGPALAAKIRAWLEENQP